MTEVGDLPIVECVPNISEGRDLAAIDRCRAAIVAAPDVRLLHVDSGYDAHRTVFTFAGAPEAVGDAAIRLGHAVASTVDMRRHAGAHPRVGALDVCPFVPVQGVTLARCAGVARRVASTLAHDLALPVYLYEAAAFRDTRRSLPDLRAGGYEALETRLASEAWAPDFGPARRSPTLGAAIVGARPFLIAWNVSLATRDVAVARRIAGRLRTSGTMTRAEDGRLQRTAGRLPAVRAVGWEMPAYGCVQVSMNLLDHSVTPLHVAYAAVREEAAREGVGVLGSELIGLVPAAALATPDLPADAVAGADAAALNAAIEALGLAWRGPFDPDARVLERRLARAFSGGQATIAS